MNQWENKVLYGIQQIKYHLIKTDLLCRLNKPMWENNFQNVFYNTVLSEIYSMKLYLWF